MVVCSTLRPPVIRNTQLRDRRAGSNPTVRERSGHSLLPLPWGCDATRGTGIGPDHLRRGSVKESSAKARPRPSAAAFRQSFILRLRAPDLHGGLDRGRSGSGSGPVVVSVPRELVSVPPGPPLLPPAPPAPAPPSSETCNASAGSTTTSRPTPATNSPAHPTNASGKHHKKHPQQLRVPTRLPSETRHAAPQPPFDN